jgi:hypothetical protein
MATINGDTIELEEHHPRTYSDGDVVWMESVHGSKSSEAPLDDVLDAVYYATTVDSVTQTSAGPFSVVDEGGENVVRLVDNRGDMARFIDYEDLLEMYELRNKLGEDEDDKRDAIEAACRDVFGDFRFGGVYDSSLGDRNLDHDYAVEIGTSVCVADADLGDLEVDGNGVKYVSTTSQLTSDYGFYDEVANDSVILFF